MADKTLSDIGRRELDFTGNQIAEALPEWFREDNPKLITLFEKYYENLDSDGHFGHQLHTIPTLRDILSLVSNDSLKCFLAKYQK